VIYLSCFSKQQNELYYWGKYIELKIVDKFEILKAGHSI